MKELGEARPEPEVDIAGLQERKLLEAELFSLDLQARQFGRIRDRLEAYGKDATAQYRTTLARRDEISKKLGRPEPPASQPIHFGGSPFQKPDDTLLSLPITPPRFIRDLGVFGFGTTGYVKMASAKEGVNVVAHGQHPSEGEIEPVPAYTGGSTEGSVTYGGTLHVGPESVPPDQFDPTISYFWLRNWKYLVPFPAPTIESRFTYRFDVYARTALVFGGGEAMAMAFVSLGESANLLAGTNVPINIDAGWPLMADLTQPASNYNGHSGFVEGRVTVQRSFMVSKGVPGVAIVVGAVIALSMMSEVRLGFVDYPYITVGSPNIISRISYSYEPVLVAEA
jgi:hypothetical protein